MDIDLTCLEASEYISDSIDGQLEASLEAPLRTHLERCGRCRLELLLMQGAKNSLREHLKPVPTPADVRGRIMQAIPAVRAPRASGSTGLMGIFNITGWRIPMAFAGALAIALIAFTFLSKKGPHSHTKPFDGSVVTETFNNFDKVVEGRLTPGIVSHDPAEVKAFLEQRVHFPVQVPAMKDFRLVGGQFSAAENETTAHLIYEHDGQYVYICQSDARKLIGGKHRFIPPAVLEELRQSGWSFTGNYSDCNLAMWLADSTLCSAVADVNRDFLVANLTGATLP
jgi:anti-sigma factor RsiW